MILIIDNYDSFVYNLARYVEELGYSYIVKRNDAITLGEIDEISPSHIILSPGPCTPNEAGISIPIVKTFSHKIPLLGVCLGHQAIGQAYGAKIHRAIKPIHGKRSLITHNQEGIFTGIKNPLYVTRYHSLIVSQLPAHLKVTAVSNEGEIMAFSHTFYPTHGVQFHPEAILTESGHDLLNQFLNLRWIVNDEKVSE